MEALITGLAGEFFKNGLLGAIIVALVIRLVVLEKQLSTERKLSDEKIEALYEKRLDEAVSTITNLSSITTANEKLATSVNLVGEELRRLRDKVERT